MVGVPVGIRTGHLPYTSQRYYRLIQIYPWGGGFLDYYQLLKKGYATWS
jgi:hypothetical protein